MLPGLSVWTPWSRSCVAHFAEWRHHPAAPSRMFMRATACQFVVFAPRTRWMCACLVGTFAFVASVSSTCQGPQQRRNDVAQGRFVYSTDVDSSIGCRDALVRTAVSE